MATYAELYDAFGIETYKRDPELTDAIKELKRLGRELERREGRLKGGYSSGNKTKKTPILTSIIETAPDS